MTVSQRDTRTGNALLRKALFTHSNIWFDPAYGTTGGEDSDFFQKQIRNGRRFVWCDEAVVHGTRHQERCTIQFHLKSFSDSELLRENASGRPRIAQPHFGH